MLDYGVLLKLDDGLALFTHSFKLLKLLYMTKSPQYTRAMCLHMMTLFYYRSKKLPAWKVWVKNVSCYNEECGEVSFAVLARAIVGDTKKHKFEHLDRLYRSTTYQLMSSEEFSSEFSNVSQKVFRYKVDESGYMADWVVEFFKEAIRLMAENKYASPDHKTMDGKKADEQDLDIRFPVVYWSSDMTKMLEDDLQWVQANWVGSDYGNEQREVWGWPPAAEKASEGKRERKKRARPEAPAEQSVSPSRSSERLRRRMSGGAMQRRDGPSREVDEEDDNEDKVEGVESKRKCECNIYILDRRSC